VAEFPPLGHPKTGTDPWDLTAICKLLPVEPPKESKVCCVIVARRWPESMNVVCSALPFHKICDWGTKPLPFTVSTTDSVLPGIGSGAEAGRRKLRGRWPIGEKSALHSLTGVPSGNRLLSPVFGFASPEVAHWIAVSATNLLACCSSGRSDSMLRSQLSSRRL
jgi:hypothetical protein